MSNFEGMSKREQLRARRRSAETRSRFITIALIVVGAGLLAFFLIYPQVKPIASVQAGPPSDRPNVNRNSSGDPNAPVQLTEYSDYQCPYCKRFWEQTEAQIIDAYVRTGKVYFTYRSAGNWVSGNIGQGGVESENSAMAAYCAADQNKFWEFHDALFTNVLGEDAGSFTERRLQAMADTLGLNSSDFKSCYGNNKYKDQVNQDFNDARAAGITGTPFFVLTYTVSGQTQNSKVEGAQPFSAFQQAIDVALTAAGK